MSPPPRAFDPSLTVRLGIAGHAVLAFGVPATFGLVVAPLSSRGFEVFIGGLIVALIVPLPLIVLTPIALIRKPPWGRRWARLVCTALLAGWLATLAIALGYPLGLLHPQSDSSGSLAPLGWTGLVFAVVLAIPAWLVVRLLRDPAVRG